MLVLYSPWHSSFGAPSVPRLLSDVERTESLVHKYGLPEDRDKTRRRKYVSPFLDPRPPTPGPPPRPPPNPPHPPEPTPPPSPPNRTLIPTPYPQTQSPFHSYSICLKDTESVLLSGLGHLIDYPYPPRPPTPGPNRPGPIGPYPDVPTPPPSPHRSVPTSASSLSFAPMQCLGHTTSALVLGILRAYWSGCTSLYVNVRQTLLRLRETAHVSLVSGAARLSSTIMRTAGVATNAGVRAGICGPRRRMTEPNDRDPKLSGQGRYLTTVGDDMRGLEGSQASVAEHGDGDKTVNRRRDTGRSTVGESQPAIKACAQVTRNFCEIYDRGSSL
ncbi:hypothetical protein F5Y15DRAFT_281691 [Xylariaceae sp. FL0016]|nr:hypothetical protein F5Y15DRAFT_281691 [Xylariaceae sp. FL0016]